MHRLNVLTECIGIRNVALHQSVSYISDVYDVFVYVKRLLFLCLRQIVARPKHRFNSSSLYRDVTLLVWDPAPYSSNLTEVSCDCFQSSTKPLFQHYRQKQTQRPGCPVKYSDLIGRAENRKPKFIFLKREMCHVVILFSLSVFILLFSSGNVSLLLC